MRDGLRLRFWLECALATVTAVLTGLTLYSREWIEVVFGVDPDNGDGSLETALVVSMLAATIAFSILARSEWRRHLPSPTDA